MVVCVCVCVCVCVQQGCTALQMACDTHKTFTAITLIQYGCDINTADKVDYCSSISPHPISSQLYDLVSSQLSQSQWQ